MRECDGPGTLLPQHVFFNKLFFSPLNILRPYRGQYILVASFVLCQHDQGKHPLGLSLSFFISLSSSFHPPFFTLSPAFSSSFTLTPSWFCLFFPSLRWKPPHSSFHSSWSGPNEVAYLMNSLPLFSNRHTLAHTHSHMHADTYILLAYTLTTLAHIAVEKETNSAHVHTLVEDHNSLMHHINICIGG